MTIPQSFIQELLARVDVVEIVGRYVPLRKGGANFMGLCPFHGEKSPSFSVSPVKQFYHCFGCGKNGNAISFLMDHAGMSFPEAVEDLAQQVGLKVPEDDLSPQERARQAEQREKQATLSDVLEKAGEAYRKHLKGSQRAIAYLKGRGLSGEIAKQFGLGYAPEGWRTLAGVFPQYDDPLLAESGLVIVNEEDDKRYDRFRDRIMFPIRNVKGECIGFGGRVLGDEKPKYLNSPETPVFHKGRELYGLFEARHALRDAGYVLVTEGYMDVVALAQLGFPNAVATLGTACTPEHVQKLFRFTDAVVFSFDGDAAGQRAARKALDGALPHASDVRSVKFLFLPAEHDPDSYIRSYGPAAFAQQVSEAMPLSRFLVEAASEGCDLSSAEGRARLASQAKPLWQPLPEGALKRQLLGDIAQRVQLSNQELTEVWHGQPVAPAPVAPPMDDGYASAPEAPQAAPRRTDRPGFKSKFGKSRSGKPSTEPRPAQGTSHPAPASRADHAARLLLNDMAGWDTLTHEDHALLCELPAPHGPLFVWLDSLFQDQGPLPPDTLRTLLPEAPQAAAFDTLAHQALTQLPPDTSADPEAHSEATQELRALIDLILNQRLMQLENEAIAAGDLDRYRHLHERRRTLALQASAS